VQLENELLGEMLAVLPGTESGALTLHSAGGLPSVFPVSELATASIAAAALSAGRLIGSPAVSVDRRLGSAWFGMTLDPIGWGLPPVWDAISGDYLSRSGWIRLHANAPRHRAAALAVLGVEESVDAVRAAVGAWDGDALEAAVVAGGGCAALLRSPDDWGSSPAGHAVREQPLISWTDLGSAQTEREWGTALRPLSGLRVLDLTRVLAGPVATRFLALLGADVLRIDPPGWDEGVIPEVMLGKRSARLDLRIEADRATFTELLSNADVLVHGYRPGALEGLGFGEDERQHLRPGLIDVTLDAYGWAGPLSGRRGFDSLVQMSTGIAYAGMTTAGAAKPVPLPVQALDHATGYLIAAAVLNALAFRRETGTGRGARLSLARTAQLLLDHPDAGDHAGFEGTNDELFAPELEHTTWGEARRMQLPFAVAGVELAASPSRALGLDRPQWR
jgi:hypothetical protein